METMGSPRFLADLRSHALLQRLRWTRLAWPLRHRRCCLPTPDTGSASTRSDFGALHTAYDLAVYASPLRLPSRRKTRFRLAATLGRTGLIPARSVRKVSKTPLSSLTHVISSPFPRLSLAHAWHLYISAAAAGAGCARSGSIWALDRGSGGAVPGRLSRPPVPADSGGCSACRYSPCGSRTALNVVLVCGGTKGISYPSCGARHPR